MDIRLLFDKHLGRSVGVIGSVSDEDCMTVPCIGYDTSRPLNEALYRRLVIFSLIHGHERNKRVHQSSGVPQFKMSRGATPNIEYTAVYTKHLSKRRARVWKLLEKISPLYEKMLMRYQL